jgi:CRISPR/Cas system CMR-associated protein Cmr5 small subunit
MQNLEQIRAAAALAVADKTTKADVSKLPAMIISNGLLAATAFATEMTSHGD